MVMPWVWLLFSVVFMGGLALVLAWNIVRGLCSGQVQGPKATYRRAEQPRLFWLMMVAQGLLMLLFLAMLCQQLIFHQEPGIHLLHHHYPAPTGTPVAVDESQRQVSVVGFIGLIAWCAWDVLRALYTGQAGGRGTKLRRCEQPLQFWCAIGAQCLFALFILVALSHQLSPRP